MQFDFLSAADGTKISKTIREKAPGHYETESYPHIGKFNSHSVDVGSPEELMKYLQAYGAEGLCLLKGTLDKKLEQESRAGHTDSRADTEWLCLDVDFPLSHDPREFLIALDPAFTDVSFVAQASASHGIRFDTQSWRGHLFVLLDKPVNPKVIKTWLVSRNLELSTLTEHLELSANGFALRYPLDITTCQNDKLIYIAPPTCENFDDPTSSRWEFVEGTHDRASFQPAVVPGKVEADVNSKVMELRAESGFEKRKAQLSRSSSGLEVLKNPEPMIVTGTREARGFVYLNLNGGDSWAYFFNPDNPEIVRNFKDEPAMYLRDVDQELYEEYLDRAGSNSSLSKQGEPLFTEETTLKPFVFRNPQADQYYAGIYRGPNFPLELYKTASKDRLKDFLAQYGEEIDDIIVDWTMEFAPNSEVQIDFKNRWINTYSPTLYMRLPADENATIPPTIDKVLTSLSVDNETKEHLIDWLAAIIQDRKKLGTSWLLQGIQGTGKGLLFNHIMRPILGEQHCVEVTTDGLDDSFFSAGLDKILLLFIDEANVKSASGGDRIMAKLKNLITEDKVRVREMRCDPVMKTSYLNIILATNEHEVLPIDMTDRRINVAPRQESPIQISHEEVLGLENELGTFTQYLKAREVNSETVRRVLLSETRESFIKGQRSSIEAFFDAIRGGDLDYFTGFIMATTPADAPGFTYIEFEAVIEKWILHANTSRPLPREEIEKAYYHLQGGRRMGANKFGKMCAARGLKMENIKHPEYGQIIACQVDHVWHMDPEEKDERKPHEQDNVRALKP